LDRRSYRQTFAEHARIRSENAKRRELLADADALASKSADVGLTPSEMAALLAENLAGAQPVEMALARWLATPEAAIIRNAEIAAAGTVRFQDIVDGSVLEARSMMEKLQALEFQTQGVDAPGQDDEIQEAHFDDAEQPCP
jgi:hypothetical protein